MPSLYQFKTHLKHRVNHPPSSLMLRYLDCFHPESNQKFTHRIVEDFYLQLLHDPYYRSINSALSHSLLDEIQPFFRNHFLTKEFSNLKNNLPSQLIAIEKTEHLLSSIKHYYQQNSAQQTQIDTLWFEKNYVMVLKFYSDGSLHVFTHSPIMTLHQGLLRPLPALSILHYNSKLELDLFKQQQIFHSPKTIFHFQIHPHGIDFKHTHYSQFTLHQRSHLQNIKEQNDAFTLLKKMENYFIKPKSDEHYKQLIQSLQSAYQLLIATHPDALRKANLCMQEAKYAITNFYPNDRLLLLLFANIEYRVKFYPQTNALNNHYSE